MYDFLFYFFIRLFKRWKIDDPEGNAIGFVLVSISGQLFLVISSINYFFGYNIAQVAFGKGSSKYVALPFVIGLMALIYRIYKNRKEKVYAKYASLEDVNGTANSLIVFFVIVVPFFLAIYFLNN
jgi:hypothetical protein